MPVDPEMLRAVMRHWPTGVAVLFLGIAISQGAFRRHALRAAATS